MSLAYYLALACGAAVVLWAMPSQRRTSRNLLALAGAVVLGGLLLVLPIGGEEGAAARPGLAFYAFGFISLMSAVMVVTHSRPVYSALYFVLVVLSTAAMMVMLQAEFMAFAMVIIYGGAILVTYMFVIMLATLPQTAEDPEGGALYDRVARRPFAAVVLGFGFLGAMSGVIFEPAALPAAAPAQRGQNLLLADIADLPGKLRPQRIEEALHSLRLIGPAEHVYDATRDVRLSEVTGVGQGVILLRSSEGTSPRRLELKAGPDIDERRQLLEKLVANVDQVGLNLFRGHTLGIELAGIILLLAMVGAAVVSRRPVEDSGQEAGA